uniref:ABC-type xenobiotic transporter n=1 Tax=Vitis vinifera TaxID=29760 RepID=F6HUQ9_VITVI
MGEDLWDVFCGNSGCSRKVGKICTTKLLPSQKSRCSTKMPNSAAIFNGGLGLVYLGFGFWMVAEKPSNEDIVLPLYRCLMVLSQGFTWSLLGVAVWFKRHQLAEITLMRLCSIFAFFFAGFLCLQSLWEPIVENAELVKIVLDILSFPGAILLLFCTFWTPEYAETKGDTNGAAFYTPLSCEEACGGSKINSEDNLTPFAKAGFLSRMSFWWLNSLLKKGKKKTLEDRDVPLLRREDRAETCYSMFLEQQNKQKQKESSDPPSMLTTIFFCYWKEIFITGLFALIKVLALATGPLFVRAFIMVAEGKEAFKYEGYALTGGLFLTKCLESLLERQWFFRTRLIGLQVRSLLSAAIYQKQLRLSNTAKASHSSGEIMNYVTVDTYRIGEFPYWLHQVWSTSLQMCLAILIVYYSVGLATVVPLLAILLTVLVNSPLGKLQLKYQIKLMAAQDRKLKAFTESLINMKILKLYAWETHFKNVIEGLRKEESQWLSAVLMKRAQKLVLFWSCPVLGSAATFWACYFLGIPLTASSAFTFLASLRIVQEPIRLIPEVVSAFIEAKVSLTRIVKFLEAPEVDGRHVKKMFDGKELEESIFIKADRISWDNNSTRATLRNINLVVKHGEKVAICGEVGSGKSTLLAVILGEVPHVDGKVQAYGKMAYVSQAAWIQTGTIQENILFGSAMDPYRYREVIEKCSLVKDLEMLPFGDLTEIGERGVNLSGGQKQRVQLARALYQDADVYLLDDPFSAVDAHTAASLFNEYVMGALSSKTVILVTHQVDFLPAFDSVLLMSEGEILQAATYDQLMHSSQEFWDLVEAHKGTAGSERQQDHASSQKPNTSKREIQTIYTKEEFGETSGDQLIKKEERETGDTGFKPYIQYLKQSKGFLYFSFKPKLLTVYTVIGFSMIIFLFFRSIFIVVLGLRASESIFSTLLSSLFQAPMFFYDSTPLGRILSRVSSDLSVVDLDLAFKLTFAVGAAVTTYSSFGVVAIFAWQLLFVIVPTIYLTTLIQSYYFASAKELMRISGTTKSLVASHLAESVAGAMTIRAFREEDRLFSKNLDLIDTNASPLFHNFTANEWYIQRLEIISAIALSSAALALTLLPEGASKSGFVGMALSYGLSLNVFLVFTVQNQCSLANMIISVERLEQYMHIPSEAPEVIEYNRPPPNWPAIGEVEICDLKVRYQPNSPLVLQGISCKFEGGQKIGIVGRTGSGKTTLISTLFRLVEPTEGHIIIDGLNISTIGLYDLRSRLGIIPQEPTLFSGSVRYNLDPLSRHTDHEIWEVLGKCQLRGAVEEKDEGLDSLVVQDGSNWSMGQRQLFCLARALLKKSRILVLDEATASIDNATDSILQKTIRTEFADCTVITVAHRIPTVMDCTMVLTISDGKLVEYDEVSKLINKEGSLFGQLVHEYWSRASNFTACGD